MSGSRRFRRGAVAAAAALLLSGTAACVPSRTPPPASLDVLIVGGRLLDGSGNPWVYADVGLKGDRIVFVGEWVWEREAGTVIDASGLYVAPGFIDTHTHAGSGLDDEELGAALPLLAQGITTTMVNPDGGGPTDLPAQREALMVHGIGVNAGQMIGHNSVRQAVIGNEDVDPTPEELEEMRELVRAGMEAGAYGLSSGPFYVPGSYSETPEMTALAEIAAHYDGIHQSHVRDESDYSIGLVASVEELITVSRQSGVRGIVTHIKALGPHVWGASEDVIGRIEAAREEGLEIFADQYPWEASSTGLSAALLPRWAEAGGRRQLLQRFEDPDTMARIRTEMADNLDRRGGAERIQFRRFGPDPAIEGKTLARVAAERGLDPIGAAIELFKEGSPSIVSFNMDEGDIRAFMTRPWTMTASDGSLPRMGEGVPHPRAYGTFPRKIRKYVLEDGVVDLAFAVRSMTSLPATVFRIEGRGTIRPDAFADVIVFDLSRIRDVGTYDDPHHHAEGMVHVLVNGRFAVRDGAFTGECPGRVLTRR